MASSERVNDFSRARDVESSCTSSEFITAPQSLSGRSQTKNLIVHVTVVHPRYDTRILYKQCASLRESGYSVVLLVADGHGDEQFNDVIIRDIGLPPFGRLGRVIVGSARIWRSLRSTGAAAIQFHDPELLPLALLMAACGRTVAFDMHENLPKELLTKTWVPGSLRRVLGLLAKIFQSAACRIVPTIFAERSYASDFPRANRSIVALNYPLAQALLQIRIPKRVRFTIGYLGAVSVERGAIEMVAAVTALRKTGVDAEALLVGPLRADVQMTQAFRGALKEPWMTATGRLKPVDAWHKMAECHVGMAILHPSPNYVDSLPTKLFEYMALGVPVIASEFPLWRGIIEDAECGILVDPADSRRIAGALHWLHAHPDEAIIMGQRGRRAVQEKYSWESQFKNLRYFYERILGREGDVN